MRLIPKKNTLRKGVLIYRRIRYRKGYGVHSPFVYNLIIKVIEEKHPFYSFKEIELLRKQLRFDDRYITYPDRHHKGHLKKRKIGDIVEREAITSKRGALLFRLVNYFKSENILQLGPSVGLSTLYLTSYATCLKCIALENIPAFVPIAKQLFDKAARNPIDLRVGDYKELLPSALSDMNKIDFVFFNTLYEQSGNTYLFDECLKYIHNESVFVFDGIRANNKMRTFWKEICKNPEVTVTIDLYSLGIVFFNKKLHKRDYKVYFETDS